MKNYIEAGETVTLLAAPEAVDSGEFIKSGALFGVAQAAADSGAPVVLKRRGVFELPKATGAWSQGDQLYWDAGSKNFTKTAAANTPIGIAYDDAASDDTTGQVALEAGGPPEAGVAGVAEGYKVARGVASITGSGTVVTGLASVVAIIATLQDDAALTGSSVTASIGDQAGSPAAGSVILKVWKPTSSSDTTPIASAGAKSVNWVAVGT